MKPTELTYRDYREHVKTAAEAAHNAFKNFPDYDDDDDKHDAVAYAVQGDKLYTHYGYMLMTVLLSDQSPESPDYCERWSVYVDLTADPTWSDCVQQMAYVCYYSDVMEQLNRMMEDDDE